MALTLTPVQLLVTGTLPPSQPDNQDPSTFGWKSGDAATLVSYAWQGHSFGQVASGTEKLWDAMLNELVPSIQGGLIDGELGGYENRPNRNNPGVLSFHAYGLALDINSGHNANGSAGYGRKGVGVIPGEAAHAAAAKYGMISGVDFLKTPDPMHMEIHVTPQEAASFSGGGSGGGSGTTPATPTTVDTKAWFIIGAVAVIGAIILFTQVM